MDLIAMVKGINESDDLANITVVDKDGTVYNLKFLNYNNSLQKEHTYLFNYHTVEGSERVANIIDSYKEITELPFEQEDSALRLFYAKSPIERIDAIKLVNEYINKIENKIIKEITKSLIEKYHDKYFIYPAAAKLHHAYVGGLAYHSIGMAKFADGFIENYPYLNKDYIYAGILLHDIGKVTELTGVMDTSYSLKGQLLGHLVLGAMEIEDVAKKLGYENTDEVMLLEHMLISHHGLPQFGAAKKPTTPEALVLWYIDTIDSKFRVLGEALENTEAGSYTEAIGVLDKMKVYKPKN